MQKIAQFLKVSPKQFEKDFRTCLPKGDSAAAYEHISLPCRATPGAAGYDFVTPVAVSLKPGQSVRIPTGIRARMEEGWVLLCFPRSGLGFRYRLQLDNTVGVIDSDYFHAENEGHIMIQITNDSRESKKLSLSAGNRFAQGIFLPFGLAETEETEMHPRAGGFGSTGS